MKPGIHPKYQEVEARCACGNTFKTRSTKPEMHLDICNACHPFFTGRQKLIDTEGRVERFTKRFGAQSAETARRWPRKPPKRPRRAKARENAASSASCFDRGTRPGHVPDRSSGSSSSGSMLERSLRVRRVSLR